MDTFIEDLRGTRRNINQAYLVMVAIDKDGKPVPVEKPKLETDAEKAEWEAGKRRYDLRRQRLEEGF